MSSSTNKVNTGQKNITLGKSSNTPTLSDSFWINYFEDDPDGYTGEDLNLIWQTSTNNETWEEVGNDDIYVATLLDEDTWIRGLVNYTDDKGFEEIIETESVFINPSNKGNAKFLISGIPDFNSSNLSEFINFTVDVEMESEDPNGNLLSDVEYTWHTSNADWRWANGTYPWSTKSLEINWQEKAEGEIYCVINYVDEDGYQETVTTESFEIPAYLSSPIEMWALPYGESIDQYDYTNSNENKWPELVYEFKNKFNNNEVPNPNTFLDGSSNALYNDWEDVNFNLYIETGEKIFSSDIKKSFHIFEHIYTINKDNFNNNLGAIKNTYNGDSYTEKNLKFFQNLAFNDGINGYPDGYYVSPQINSFGFKETFVPGRSSGFTIERSYHVDSPDPKIDPLEHNFYWDLTKKLTNGNEFTLGVSDIIITGDPNEIPDDYYEKKSKLGLEKEKSKFFISGKYITNELLEIVETEVDSEGSYFHNYNWQTSTDKNNWEVVGLNPTYTINDQDKGKYIRCLVNYKDGNGSFEEILALKSNFSVESYIQQVSLNGGFASFSIKGDTKIGSTLEISENKEDPDGTGSLSYSWQSSEDNISWAEIGKLSKYELTTNEENKYIKAVISYEDNNGFRENVSTESIQLLTNDLEEPEPTPEQEPFSLIWTKLLGSSANDFVYQITTGNDGSIYITGFTNGNLGGQINSGSADAFISKFDSDGNKKWTQLLGSSNDDYSTGITTGDDGSIYITGETEGNLDEQVNSGSGDAFISKFDSNGNKKWTQLLGSSNDDESYGITTGDDGSIYITGETEGNLDEQVNSGGWDVFISKFTGLTSNPEEITKPDSNPIAKVTEPYQTVSASSEEISFSPGKDINFDLVYTTSDSQNALTGLELKVHYDSSVFTPSGENNGVSALVDTFGDPSIIDDTDDFDNDANTDKYLNIIWADFTAEPNFPGTELPATLATLNFSSSKEGVDSLTGENKESKINFTSSDPAMNYDFLSQSVFLKPQSFNLDVDGDGKVAALGDGLMVIRKLFGAAFAGDVLTNKAISNTATRTTQEIHNFIQAGIDEKVLDVDGDGSVTALGDGLMVIRKLFGAAFAGDALTDKALSTDATRTTDEIHEYIAAMSDVGSAV